MKLVIGPNGFDVIDLGQPQLVLDSSSKKGN